MCRALNGPRRLADWPGRRVLGPEVWTASRIEAAVTAGKPLDGVAPHQDM